MLVMRPIRSSVEGRKLVNEYLNKTYFSTNGFKWGSVLYHREDDRDTGGNLIGFIIVGDPLSHEHNDGTTVQILKCFTSEEKDLRKYGLTKVKVSSVLMSKACEAASHIGFERILGHCQMDKDEAIACRHLFRYA